MEHTIKNIKAEVERLRDSISGCRNDDKKLGELKAYDKIIHFINSHHEEQPEYSCIETIYHRGKKPRWNIGDLLAYNEFCSDREGEYILGRIISVELDQESDDWIYIFENGDREDENSLIEEKTYKKN